MYKNLKKSTILCKLICLILLFISIFITNNIYIIALLVILTFVYSIFTDNYKLILLPICLPLIYFFSSNIIVYYVFKGFLLFTYFLIFLSILSKKEERFLLEKLFYHNKNNTKWILKRIYYKDKKKLNISEIDNNNRYLKKQIKGKTLYDMNDVYIFSKIKYYNFYKTKKNIFLNKWSEIDNTLIFISCVILVLSICMRWL